MDGDTKVCDGNGHGATSDSLRSGTGNMDLQITPNFSKVFALVTWRPLSSSHLDILTLRRRVGAQGDLVHSNDLAAVTVGEVDGRLGNSAADKAKHNQSKQALHTFFLKEKKQMRQI